MLERDGWTCMNCSLPIDQAAEPADDQAATLDHVITVWDGGSDEIENLRATHRWCNVAREGNPVWSDDETIRERARLRFSAAL